MKALELKVPPVGVAIVCAAIMWGASDRLPSLAYTLPLRIPLSFVLGASGLAVALAGIVEFRRARTTINPTRPGAASVMVTSGVYRVSRNPMYVGLLFALASWAVFISHALAFVGLPIFIAYMNRFQIAPEECALSSKFGAEFSTYKMAVRRWL